MSGSLLGSLSFIVVVRVKGEVILSWVGPRHLTLGLVDPGS